MSPPRLVLGSTSRYRADLLRRLCLEFEQRAPGTDETALPGEAPDARALRLAMAKAEACAQGLHNALVIGSDQVAELDGRMLDKPGTPELAREQLAASSGRSVQFRVLGADEIARYVERERPLDCAGSFKCEGLGISLFERIDNEDPSALIGLPLIALARLLRTAGVALP